MALWASVGLEKRGVVALKVYPTYPGGSSQRLHPKRERSLDSLGKTGVELLTKMLDAHGDVDGVFAG